MRVISDAQRRWRTLIDQYHFPSVADLRHALKTKGNSSPCDEGLRAVCWRAFLLHEDVDKPTTWLAQVETSRDAYTALRTHFLKYIERPDDLSSAVDPLAEDDESPWQILRNDETIRNEIFQDVERCLQENHFFREPTTKARMLDILFIYAKLNPDLGYRQGMHELLAPVLWVVAHDAIDKSSCEEEQAKDAVLFRVLDADYIEHDSFTLFCAIMQTAKQFYEHNGLSNSAGSQEVSPIIVHSQRIHQEVLRSVDADLADHLQAIEILPQIFVTRWVRLLFGREFDFQDMISMWDLLFSEKLSLNIIDLVCVVMLLRIRQPLLDSDYSSALGLLLRYPSPEPFTAVDFVLDALFLAQNHSPKGAASLVSKYSGRVHRQLRGQSVDSALKANGPLSSPPRKTLPSREPRRPASETPSPNKSPVRIGSKRFDSIFQDVSEGLYRRTENWGVARAVRGAVGEARRNMQQQLQSSASSPGLFQADDSESKFGIPRISLATHEELNSRISALEDRNKLLARMLGEAMGTLMSQREDDDDSREKHTKGRNEALDKIKYVKTRLEDSDLPITQQGPDPNEPSTATETAPTPIKKNTQQPPDAISPSQHPTIKENAQPNPTSEPSIPKPTTPQTTSPPNPTTSTSKTKVETPLPVRPSQRASLAESQFSWMLGDTGPRSSFMTCASAPPERERERREVVEKLEGQGQGRGLGRPQYLFGDARSENGRDRDGEKGEEEDFVALGPLGRISE